MSESAPSRADRPRIIVVGVDGSPGSLVALQFALAEARLRDAEVRAVQAWTYPDVYADWPVVSTEAFDPRKAATRVLAGAISQVTQGTDATVSVTPIVAQGPAATVLLEASKDADLLVVGSRGRGGFVGLLLGSVSQQCVQHATVPVVVVPLKKG